MPCFSIVSNMKSRKFFRKIRTTFRGTNPQLLKILIVRRIIIGVYAKNLKVILLSIDFSIAFDSIHREKMEQIILAYSLPKETVTITMMLYKIMKAMVHSYDGNAGFFNIVMGVLQENTQMPYMFVICLNYVIQMLINLIKKLFLIKKRLETDNIL